MRWGRICSCHMHATNASPITARESWKAMHCINSVRWKLFPVALAAKILLAFPLKTLTSLNEEVALRTHTPQI